MAYQFLALIPHESDLTCRSASPKPVLCKGREGEDSLKFSPTHAELASHDLLLDKAHYGKWQMGQTSKAQLDFDPFESIIMNVISA